MWCFKNVVCLMVDNVMLLHYVTVYIPIAVQRCILLGYFIVLKESVKVIFQISLRKTGWGESPTDLTPWGGRVLTTVPAP